MGTRIRAEELAIRPATRRTWLEQLVPAAPPFASGGRAWLPVGAAVLVGAVAVILRQAGAGALDTLYGEDGFVFLVQALRTSPAHTFTTTYAGYLHVAPRLVAETAASLPLTWAAAAFSVGSALATSLLAVLVFHVSGAQLRSPAVRVLLAASVIVLPVAQEEVLASAANLQWPLLAATFWLLLWRPRRRWELVAGSLVLFLTATSSPFAGLLAPLALLRLATRQPRDQAFTLSYVAGVLVQLLVMASTASPRDLAAQPDLPRAAAMYVFHVLTRGTFGDEVAVESHGPGALLLTALGLAALTLLAVAAWRSGALRRRLPLVVCAGGASLALFVAPVALSGWAPPRYAAAPVLLLYAVVAGVLDDLGGASLSPGVRLAALAAVVALFAVNFPAHNRRAIGPTWREELSRAARACAVSPGEEVTLEITPAGNHLTLACAEIR